MLIAGASAYHSPAMDGALTFDVSTPPSYAWWNLGSAFIYIMLLASASAGNVPFRGGALTFDVTSSPLDPWWTHGSAY